MRFLARTTAAAVAGLTVVPVLAVVATAAGARAGDDVYLERRWTALPGAGGVQSARVALDTRHRVAYAFYSAADGLRVRAYDLDTYKPKGLLTEAGVPTLKAATPIAVDETAGVAVLAPTPAAQAAPEVGVYSARSGTLRRIGQAATRFPAGYAILGMAVDAPRGRMLVLGAPAGGQVVKTAGAGVTNVLLDTWKLSDLAAGRVASADLQPLRVPPACGQVLATSFPAGIMATPDGKRVLFGCLSNRGLVTPLGPNAGDVSGVAELDLAAAATGAPTALRIRPVSGDFAQGDTFAVPARGRMVLIAGSTTSTTIKVYDTASGYYVGNVGLDGKIAAAGFDARSGRGYYVNGNGFGVFDPAVTPVDQGVVYQDFATTLGILQRGIDVDPKTRRVFVVNADDVVNGPDPWIAVLRDRSEPAESATEDEVPGLDVVEVEGMHGSQRSADAAALGAEYRMVGGPSNLILNATHFDSRGILTRPGTRWLQLGHARSIRLTPDEASAEVVTMRYDDATAADADSNVLAAPVQCSDFGFTKAEVSEPGARVTCDAHGERVEGDATAQPGRVFATWAGHPEAVPAAVQVKSAEAHADAFREKDGTLVSTMTAEADGIDILGVVKIGHVTATAQVAVHGRTGTAQTTYERTISGLVVNGAPVCQAECTHEQVRKAINDTFGGRIVVGIPGPSRFASKRGTSARLTDHPLRHIERVLFDDVPGDSVLAPAMEIVVYLDGTASSRMVVSLASVSAQERYRIYAADGDRNELPNPYGPRPDVPLPPAPGSVATGGDVVTGGAVPATPSLAAPGGAPASVVTRLRDGIKVVFRSPRQLASVAALWTLLAIPTYLAARRRLLNDLPYLRRAVEET